MSDPSDDMMDNQGDAGDDTQPDLGGDAQPDAGDDAQPDAGDDAQPDAGDDASADDGGDASADAGEDAPEGVGGSAPRAVNRMVRGGGSGAPSGSNTAHRVTPQEAQMVATYKAATTRALQSLSAAQRMAQQNPVPLADLKARLQSAFGDGHQ